MTTPMPASCLRLDIGKARRELVRARGDVTAAARRLKVPSADLRQLTRAAPELIDAVIEMEEQRIDAAEAELMADLKGPDQAARLEAATHLLRVSPAARRRGWGQKAVATEAEAQPIAVKWRDD